MDASMKYPQQSPRGSQAAMLRYLETTRLWHLIRGTMPLQYVTTFATVAAYPGRSVQEYADLVGIGQTTMSRHLLDLGPRDRHFDAGYGLIDIKMDHRDRRRHIVMLTPKGEKLARDISEIMERGRS
jgi:hypothetical protein